MMDMTTLELLMATTSGGIGFAVGLWMVRMLGRAGSWLLVFFTGRQDKREEHLDAANQRLYDRMEKQIEGLTERVTKAETKLEHCEQQHAEARAEVMELRAIMQGKGQAAELAQLIIASEKKEAKG